MDLSFLSETTFHHVCSNADQWDPFSCNEFQEKKVLLRPCNPHRMSFYCLCLSNIEYLNCITHERTRIFWSRSWGKLNKKLLQHKLRKTFNQSTQTNKFILTNQPNLFSHNNVFETDLPNFYLLQVTKFKRDFQKMKPNIFT